MMIFPAAKPVFPCCCCKEVPEVILQQYALEGVTADLGDPVSSFCSLSRARMITFTGFSAFTGKRKEHS
jgi:hypothetical protein